MTSSFIRLSLSVLCTLFLAGSSLRASDLAASLKKGKPDIQSAGPLAFGPEGILFAADPWGAAVFAIDTGDKGPREKAGALKVEKLDTQAAALLGTTPAELMIQDIAVNPASGHVYISAARGRGTEAKPAIIKVSRDGKLALVSLDDVAFSKVAIPNAPSAEAKGRGGRLRLESVTDLAFTDGRVLVACISNEEFSSTFRSIPFPFTGDSKGTSVEIYHGAHGKFETNSPVRTFVPFQFGGETHLLAAYTCTPLVKIPLKELKPGAHLKGTTIAELGNQNRPLDMIVYRKDGKEFLLLANNNRGVMKITTEGIDKVEPILTAVRGGGKKGMTYETIESWKGIEQLDRYDDANALVLRKDEKGAFHMESLPLP